MSFFQDPRSIANQSAEAQAVEDKYDHAVDAMRQSQMYNGAPNVMGAGASFGGLSNYAIVNSNSPWLGVRDDFLGNFKVKKAYNGFTIETAKGEVILCPEMSDIGAQIVAYLIANRLET